MGPMATSAATRKHQPMTVTAPPTTQAQPHAGARLAGGENSVIEPAAGAVGHGADADIAAYTDTRWLTVRGEIPSREL